MRIKIGVDIDGVIANFIRGFSILARNRFGKHVPIIENKEDILTWDFSFLNITEREAGEIFIEIQKSDSFWTTLKVVDLESWRDFITEFNTDKYEVYFISNRENGINLHSQTVKWLNSVGWRNPQVILTKTKHYIIGLLEIDYFIDDNSKNCQDALMLTSADCYVYDYPHNRYIEMEYFNSEIKRVNNLTEFKNDILNKIKEK